MAWGHRHGQTVTLPEAWVTSPGGCATESKGRSGQAQRSAASLREGSGRSDHDCKRSPFPNLRLARGQHLVHVVRPEPKSTSPHLTPFRLLRTALRDTAIEFDSPPRFIPVSRSRVKSASSVLRRLDPALRIRHPREDGSRVQSSPYTRITRSREAPRAIPSLPITSSRSSPYPTFSTQSSTGAAYSHISFGQLFKGSALIPRAMSQSREGGSVRTALPTRPVASRSGHESASSHTEGGHLMPRKLDVSVSPEPRDSLMSDAVSTSSKASSPDSAADFNTKLARGGPGAPGPSGQICR